MQVKVCMVDTGVDYTHPDILANLWTNPDESANGKDNDGNGRLFHSFVAPWHLCCKGIAGYAWSYILVQGT